MRIGDLLLYCMTSHLLAISGKPPKVKKIEESDMTMEKCIEEKKRNLNCTIGNQPNSVTITEFEELGICIYDFEELSSYATAVTKCKHFGLLPLMVKSPSISEDLEDAFPVHKPVWLGARRIKLPHWTYVVTGIMIEHLDENIMDTKALRCGAVRWNREKGQVLAVSMPCWGRDTTGTKFICRPRKECDIMMLEGIEECLFYDHANNTRVSWYEARNYCHKHKGDLFFLRSGETWKFVMEYMVKNWDSEAEEEDIFVGLQIQKWIWDDETEVVYSKWSVSDSVDHDCARIFNSKELLWQSSSCYAKAAEYCTSDLAKEERQFCEEELEYTRRYVIHIVVAIVMLHVAIFGLVYWRRREKKKKKSNAGAKVAQTKLETVPLVRQNNADILYN